MGISSKWLQFAVGPGFRARRGLWSSVFDFLPLLGFLSLRARSAFRPRSSPFPRKKPSLNLARRLKGGGQHPQSTHFSKTSPPSASKRYSPLATLSPHPH